MSAVLGTPGSSARPARRAARRGRAACGTPLCRSAAAGRGAAARDGAQRAARPHVGAPPANMQQNARGPSTRAELLGRPAGIRPPEPGAGRAGPGLEAVAAKRRAARNGRSCGGARHGAGGRHGRERLREVGTRRRGEGLRCNRPGGGGRARPRLGQAQLSSAAGLSLRTAARVGKGRVLVWFFEAWAFSQAHFCCMAVSKDLSP